MDTRKELQSPTRRAKFGMMPWLEMLPKEAQLDAFMALDRLIAVAEKEIEQAYLDGHNNRSETVRSREFNKDPA